MDTVELLRRLHQHRAWVNGNLLSAAAVLSGEQLRRMLEAPADGLAKLFVTWRLLALRRERKCGAGWKPRDLPGTP